MIAAAGAATVAPRPGRAQALVAEMTLAEKLGQLSILSADYAVTGPVVPTNVDADVRAGRVGSLFNLWGRDAVRNAQRIAVEETRLGIPLFFALDVIHGFRTVFPIPLAEAGAFDPALWEETARAAAAETAAAGIDLTFAPMLDVARDPRWGRIAEGPGEDPHVASVYAAAKVRAWQAAGIATAPKHFAAYAASRAGRDYAATEVSPRTLAETYLPPFRAAVDAGALAIMPAFTDLEGIPLTAHRGLLTDLLRHEWGFDGVVISDYTAINELVAHGVAADTAEAAALALNAGVDVDMMSRAYERGLPVALDRGLVNLDTIDAAVARVLALKERLGLLDDPYVRLGSPDADLPATRAAARTAATRSLVLLRNRGDALPLPAAPGRLALVGPLADAAGEMLGPWAGAGRREEAVSVRAGLAAAFPGTDIAFAEGCPIDRPDDTAITEAAALAARADRVFLAIGEAAWMSGEAASRARIDLPGSQAALLDAIIATGTPTTILLFSGRPLVLPPSADRADALLACWFPGSEAGHAIADLLLGRAAPSAGLPVTWPRDVGQVPITYADRPGGRPEAPANKYTSKYLDLPNTPAFAFGHGLTYTRFTVSDPIVTPAGTTRVETTVTNEGSRPGTATVFLFVRDPVARIARPILELRRFTRATVAPGESATVVFELARADFAYLDADLRPVFEPGAFEVHVGLSAEPGALKAARFTLD
jgi:beta-glucosidase